MAKTVKAFVDNRGHLHVTLKGAVVADLAETLGRVGEEGGMTEGVARLILSKREEIEKAFADMDSLMESRTVKVPLADEDLKNVVEIQRKKPGNSNTA